MRRGGLRVTSLLDNIAEVVPRFHRNDAGLYEGAAAPDQQDRDAEAVEPLESVDDRERNIGFVQLVDYLVGRIRAQRRDLRLRHRRTIDEVPD